MAKLLTHISTLLSRIAIGLILVSPFTGCGGNASSNEATSLAPTGNAPTELKPDARLSQPPKLPPP
jgi:hypothetical protein